MKLKFWGVRGSIPAPILPQTIHEKMTKALQEAAKKELDLQDADGVEDFVRNLALDTKSTIGGNTTCITLEANDHLIIFDAGSGMRELGRYLMTREFGNGQGHASIFFTHTHWDHIQGLPFFVPAFIGGNRFDVYHIHPYVPEVLINQMNKEVYPVDFQGLRSEITFHQLEPGQAVTLAGMKITNIALQHPGIAYSYRIDDGEHSIVLATDGEYKRLGTAHTKRYIDFYNEADVLIFDAQFSVRESIIKEDWGHSSGLIGADIAKAAGVKQLVLFHHDPISTDEEIMVALQQAREYLGQNDNSITLQVDVAREGWEINLNQRKKLTIVETAIDQAVCLSLIGHFDSQASETFTNYVLEVVQSGRSTKIILDMSELEMLTMAGIRALLDARSNVYSLSLVNVPDSIYRVLELAGTTDFFAIYETIDAAAEVMTSSSINA